MTALIRAGKAGPGWAHPAVLGRLTLSGAMAQAVLAWVKQGLGPGPPAEAHQPNPATPDPGPAGPGRSGGLRWSSRAS